MQLFINKRINILTYPFFLPLIILNYNNNFFYKNALVEMSTSISIDEIKEGMVLAGPVVNSFGQTLIPAGATLKPSHSNLLKTWNISQVSIKGDDSSDEIEITEEIRKIVLQKLQSRAKWIPESATEKDIFELGIITEAKKMLNSNNG